MLWAISCVDKPDTAAIRDSVLQPHRIRNARAGCLAEALSVQPVALNSTIGIDGKFLNRRHLTGAGQGPRPMQFSNNQISNDSRE